MEISIPVETVFVSSNVTDTTTAYNKNAYVTYNKGELYQDEDKIYERSGETFLAPLYNIDDVSTYSVGDIVFKDGELKYITDLGIVQTKKEPKDYTQKTFATNDPTFAFRYIYLGTGATNNITFKSVDGLWEHTIAENSAFLPPKSSPTGWVHIVTELANPSNNFESEPVVTVGVATNEPDSDCRLLGDCQNVWTSNSVVRDGNNYYVRTLANTNNEPEYNYSYNPTFISLDNLDTISWGWTYKEPINPKKPFDGKNYTKLQSTVDVVTEFSSTSTFNTIAITGLIATSIKIESTASEINYSIDNRKDISNRLGASPITTILYLDRDITGTVKLTVTTNNGVVEIGETLLGLSVNGGFTNLEFANEYKDYSPTEIDQWGNVEYISGTKVNIHSGSVDMKTTNYDMINRLITSIGGSKVILNGSGNKDNLEVATEGVFSSTMIVGRITSFSQRTKIKDGDLDKMSNYTFKIEELV